MSERAESPVEANFYFNAKDGKLGVLRKGEEEIADITLPFHFMVLDKDAFTITGEYRTGQEKRKVKSTLAHNHYQRRVRVYFKDNRDEIAAGEWAAIKKNCEQVGGRYTACIFIIAIVDGLFKMGALHLRGRAFAQWLKDTDGVDVTGNFQFSLRSTEKVIGEVDSWVPRFTVGEATSEVALKAAFEMDNILQDWLRAYFAISTESPAPPPDIETLPVLDKETDALPVPAETETEIDTFNDLPF